MTSAVDALNAASTSALGNIRRATHSLMEEGVREDKPTGLTPRKRSRRMADDPPPTASRDVLVRRFRSRGTSSVGSETFLAEHLPLPEEDAGSPALDAMMVDSPVDCPFSDEENRSESLPGNSPPPLVKSLASSSSSSTSTETVPVPIAPSIPVLKQFGKIAPPQPQLGTLTDSKAANVVRTRPQRTRRTAGR